MGVYGRGISSMKTNMDVPSLDEIVLANGLEKRQLKLKCSQYIKLRISQEVSDWKMIGMLLGFKRARLDAIDRDNRTEGQRKIALFEAWSEQNGNEATYLKLAEVLLHHQRRDLVELLCELVKTQLQTATPISETQSAAQPSTAIIQRTTQAGQLYLFLLTLSCIKMSALLFQLGKMYLRKQYHWKGNLRIFVTTLFQN